MGWNSGFPEITKTRWADAFVMICRLYLVYSAHMRNMGGGGGAGGGGAAPLLLHLWEDNGLLKTLMAEIYMRE